MPRPTKQRIVHAPPIFNSFKPTGIGRSGLIPIQLSLDEYEAVRLADYLGLDHKEAAEMMEISRSTFTRLIEKARRKMAKFIIDGAELTIEGGNIHFRGNILKCEGCGHMFKTGFEHVISECPTCGSDRLIDMAGGYGHGRCCSLYGMNGHHGHGYGRNK